MNSTAAGNISLNEIFKKGALVVKRTFVHLMKCVQVQKNATDVSGNNLSDWLHFFASTVVLRIPLFKNFVKPLSVGTQSTYGGAKLLRLPMANSRPFAELRSNAALDQISSPQVLWTASNKTLD